MERTLGTTVSLTFSLTYPTTAVLVVEEEEVEPVVTQVVVWHDGEDDDEEEVTRGRRSSSRFKDDSRVTLSFLMRGGLSASLLVLLSSEGLKMQEEWCMY